MSRRIRARFSASSAHVHSGIHPLHRMRWTFPTFSRMYPGRREIEFVPKPSDSFFLAHACERIAVDNENRNLVGDVMEDSNLFGYP